MDVRVCRRCAEPLEAGPPHQKFRSAICRLADAYVRRRAGTAPKVGVPHPCEVCGVAFTARANRKTCSTACRNIVGREIGKRGWSRRAAQRAYVARRRAAGLPTNNWNETAKAADRRRRARKAGVDAELIRPISVFERDGWICGLCGGPIDPALKYPHPMSASVDHIVPLSKHGPHTTANVQAAHLRGNITKRDKVAA